MQTTDTSPSPPSDLLEDAADLVDFADLFTPPAPVSARRPPLVEWPTCPNCGNPHGATDAGTPLSWCERCEKWSLI